MNNFAVLEISYTHSAASILITVLTDNPCHLTCYHTANQPLRHKTSRIERGLATPWGAYFCFNAWIAVEQIEAGDTLSHTFSVSPWLFCQTKWFAFRGTVTGVLSPSTSPIFEHHYGLILYQHYNVGESSAYRFAATSWVAQTFTVHTPHTISQINIMLNRIGNPGQARAGIWRTDPTGHPTGGDLAAAIFNANGIILFPGKEWKQITLPSLLLGASKYAIVLRIPDSIAGSSLGWWGDTISPTYTRGNFELGSFSGTIWSAILTRDAMFEEWGT